MPGSGRHDADAGTAANQLLFTTINSLQWIGVAPYPLAEHLAEPCAISNQQMIDRQGKGVVNLALASTCQSDNIFLVFTSSPSEGIFVPITPSLANCAISVSESPRSPDRISRLCCPSVGAAVRIG